MSDEIKRLKMAAIAGASRAIRFREKNPRANEQEVVKHVADNVRDIIEKIDEEI